MNFQKILVPVAGMALVAAAYRSFGWQGVAIALGGIVMWMLLHFTRVMRVMQQAGKRPLGWVASAVMLNARLRPGVNLLHVMALTKAMGEQLSPPEAQPEVFRWTDNGGSHVTCEFERGKLARWQLWRPEGEDSQASPAATPAGAPAGAETGGPASPAAAGGPAPRKITDSANPSA